MRLSDFHPRGPRAFHRSLRVVAFAVLQVVNQPAPAAGESAPPPSVASQTVTLTQAQSQAFQRNWDLLAARSDVDIAVAQRIVAREFPNPTLNLGMSKISVDPAHPSSGTGLWERNYDSVAAVNQLFEMGGKRRDRRISTQAGVEGAEARLADARRTLDLAVARAYVAALQAEASSQVLRQSAASLGREAEIAGVRLRAGDISTADRNQIEILSQRLQLDAQAAEANARTARINLGLLLGASGGQGDFRLADKLENIANESVPDSVPSPAAGRADLRAAEAATRKAEADLKLQKAMRVPDLTLLAQYEHQPPDQPNTVGFGVSFPLPLWNRNRGNISAAAAQLEQARLAAAKVEAQVAADLAIAKVAYDDARRRWAEYRDSLRQKSSEIRESVAFAYEKGGASLLDLLTVERTDNEVRLAATQAAGDAALAAAGLKAAAEVMESSPKSK